MEWTTLVRKKMRTMKNCWPRHALAHIPYNGERLLTVAQEGAGFIADEDEDEDEVEARKERRRRKKRKNREAEEDLDEDDLDLIGIERPEREDESAVWHMV
jgi:hypothetical protein